jgi:hypothetical protein
MDSVYLYNKHVGPIFRDEEKKRLRNTRECSGQLGFEGGHLGNFDNRNKNINLDQL